MFFVFCFLLYECLTVIYLFTFGKKGRGRIHKSPERVLFLSHLEGCLIGNRDEKSKIVGDRSKTGLRQESAHTPK